MCVVNCGQFDQHHTSRHSSSLRGYPIGDVREEGVLCIRYVIGCVRPLWTNAGGYFHKNWPCTVAILCIYAESSIIISWLRAPSHQTPLGRSQRNSLQKSRDTLEEHPTELRGHIGRTTRSSPDTRPRSCSKSVRPSPSRRTAPTPPRNRLRQEGTVNRAEPTVMETIR